MEDIEDDAGHPLCLPEKNINVFIPDENIGVFPDEIFEGKMGPLPLLISVNVGYYPDDEEPFMHYYESQEIMFAYKKDAQKRVLLRDAYGRTLSLPLHSTLPFRLGANSSVLTMSEIVSRRPMPVPHVRFARTESLDIFVDKQATSHQFFGSFTVTEVYDEPFMWCLSVEANGKTKEKPIVLPRNLKATGFCPIVGISGAKDPAAKVKVFVDKYSQVASQLEFKGDPFFQELAFVSRDPQPVDTIEPYIDETTFIPIRVRRDLPAEPEDDPSVSPPPPRPPRAPCREGGVSSPGEGSGKEKASVYNTTSDSDPEDHVYAELSGNDVKPGPLTVKLSQTLPTDGLPPVPPTAKDSPTPTPPPPPQRSERAVTGGRQGSSPCSVDLMRPPVFSPRAIRSRLDAMTVEDVARKLKDLGLEKYAKKFRKNLIDGVLLQKIKEEDLKKEFNMSHMEFVVLHTFVHEGHVPQTSRSKTGGKSLF